MNEHIVKTIELLNKIPEQDRKIKQLQSENEALKRKLDKAMTIIIEKGSYCVPHNLTNCTKNYSDCENTKQPYDCLSKYLEDE